MKPIDLARRFFEKSRQDEAAAIALTEHEEISDEILGFHCQQAVEKSLKAVLAYKEIPFRKTHDLIELMQLLEDNSIPLPSGSEQIEDLGPFAVTWRYDFFDEPDTFDVNKSLEAEKEVRLWARTIIRE